MKKNRNRHLLMSFMALILNSLWLCMLDIALFFLTTTGSEQGLTGFQLFTLYGGQSIGSFILICIAALTTFGGPFLSQLLKHKLSVNAVRSAFLGLIGAGVFLPASLELSSGDWISQQSYSWIIPPFFTILGGLFVAILARSALFAYPKTASRSWILALFVGGCLSFSALAAFANVKLYYNLYPLTHITIFCFCATFGIVAILALLNRHLQNPKKTFQRMIMIFSTLLFVAGAFVFLTMDRTTRSALINKSTTATDIIRQTAQVASSTNISILHEVLSTIVITEKQEDEKQKTVASTINVPSDWNVILLINDATRADIFPPNIRKKGRKHAKPKDAPFMNKWLKKTTRFKYAYSQAANTQRSMPAFFRSLNAHEDTLNNGTPLAYYAKSLGKKPIAVIPSFFQEPTEKRYPFLLEGFEKLDFYHQDEQSEMLPKIVKMLNKVKDQPFFAWIHTYSMHSPGYAKGRRLKKSDGSSKSRYRKSLQWLDVQLAGMFQHMEKIGLSKNTIVIIAADHGCALGEHHTNSHGSTVWEETVRVPLAFYIPGQGGKSINDKVVGNIDVLPTIGDLLGGTTNPHHQGKSLLPLLNDPKTKWDGEYFLKARRGTIVGLVHNRQKLIHDIKGDALYHFDLKKDPKEEKNIFNINHTQSRDLLIKMMRHVPNRFAKQLDNTSTQQLLHRHLDAIQGNALNSNVLFLLKLAPLDPSKKSLTLAKQLYERTSSKELKLNIINQLMKTDQPFWEQKLIDEIITVAKTGEDLQIAKALAANGQTQFAPKLIGKTMHWWASTGSLSQWEPWLYLVEKWPSKSAKRFSPPLIQMLTKLEIADNRTESAQVSTQLMSLILGNIATVKFSNRRSDEQHKQVLKSLILPYLKHKESAVQAAACLALGNVGDEQTAHKLRRLLQKNPPMHVKQAAVRAIFYIEDSDLNSLLAEHGSNPDMAWIIINIINDHLIEDGLPFLKETIKHHYRPRVKRYAKKTRRLIEHHMKKKKT